MSKISKEEESYNKAISSRDRYQSYADNYTHCKPFKKFSLFENSLKFGDHFLYQIVDNDGISYPKMAIFVKYLSCDQTVELQFVDRPRTWMDNIKYISNSNFGYESIVSDSLSNFTTHIEWNSMIYIFGIWDKSPNWKEMRQAYERTIWFNKGIDWVRDQQIKRIL